MRCCSVASGTSVSEWVSEWGNISQSDLKVVAMVVVVNVREFDWNGVCDREETATKWINFAKHVFVISRWGEVVVMVVVVMVLITKTHCVTLSFTSRPALSLSLSDTSLRVFTAWTDTLQSPKCVWFKAILFNGKLKKNGREKRKQAINFRFSVGQK